MIRLFLGTVALTLSLIACGSDDSDSIHSTNKDIPEEDSSSSIRDDGDDESSSSRNAQSDNKSSSDQETSSSSSKGIASSSSSIDSTGGFIEIHGTPIKTDSVEESYYTYKTVQIGTKIWLAENLQYEHSQSICYDRFSQNCRIWGRLYRTDVPKCPSGFRIATQEDWQDLFERTGSVKNLRTIDKWKVDKLSQKGLNAFGFSLLPAGSCNLDTCTGMKVNTTMLVSEPLGYYTFTADSDSATFKSGFNSSLYASVRCVMDSKNFFSESDLPETCYNGDRVSVKDYIYYECDNSKTWQPSTATTPSTCSENEELKNAIYKGTRYNCRSENYYKVTAMEDAVGFCSLKNRGDTLTYKDTLFACDSTTWIKASVRHVFGECVQNERDSIYTFNNTKYVCQDSTWRPATSDELQYGLCLESMFGTFADESKSRICKDHAWKYPTRDDLLGSCSIKNTGKTESYGYETYICKDSTWVKSTYFEQTYGPCTSLNEGEVQLNKYICKNSTWTEATTIEILGTCSSKNEYEMKPYGEIQYICKKSAWSKADSYENKYGACTPDNEGKIEDAMYICKSGYWASAKKEEVLGACTADNAYEIKKYTVHNYICKNNMWDLTSVYENEYGACTGERQGERADTVICKNGSWILMTPQEYYGSCTAEIQDTVILEKICDNLYWRAKNTQEKKVGDFCTTTTAGKKVTFKYSKEYYVCYKGAWVSTTEVNYNLGICSTAGETNAYNDTLYTCMTAGFSNYTWSKTKINVVLDSCNANDIGDVKTYKGKEYVCRSTGWGIVNDIEREYGYCTSESDGKNADPDGVAYVCKDGLWAKATKSMYLGECNTGDSKTYYGQEYVCRGDGWEAVYGTLKDSRDGQTYRTIVLHNAVWMADNLNYETANSWCYSNSPSKCDEYGRLYTYEDAMKACPTGWHIPSITKDYADLYFTYYGYSTRSVTGWQGINGTGYSDLDVKASGIRKANGSFIYETRLSGYWFADEYNSDETFINCINPTNSVSDICTGNGTPVPAYTSGNSTTLRLYTASKDDAFPVRCVKD